jgi:uncharacterized alkaline shock family protein YloU
MSDPARIAERPRIITSLAAAAAANVAGVVRVGRGGPRLLAELAGPAVVAWIQDGRVHLRLWVIVEGGRSIPELARRVRTSVADAVERQMGLELGEVTVLVDGVRG